MNFGFFRRSDSKGSTSFNKENRAFKKISVTELRHCQKTVTNINIYAQTNTGTYKYNTNTI